MKHHTGPTLPEEGGALFEGSVAQLLRAAQRGDESSGLLRSLFSRVFRGPPCGGIVALFRFVFAPAQTTHHGTARTPGHRAQARSTFATTAPGVSSVPARRRHFCMPAACSGVGVLDALISNG